MTISYLLVALLPLAVAALQPLQILVMITLLQAGWGAQSWRQLAAIPCSLDVRRTTATDTCLDSRSRQ